MSSVHDVIVVGGGHAGTEAALAAALNEGRIAGAERALFFFNPLLDLTSNDVDDFFLTWVFVKIMSLSRVQDNFYYCRCYQWFGSTYYF